MNGTVKLGGTTLVLSGSHPPASSDNFVIVDNDLGSPVTGTFNGL